MADWNSASIKYLHTVVYGRGRLERKSRQRKFEKNAYVPNFSPPPPQ